MICDYNTILIPTREQIKRIAYDPQQHNNKKKDKSILQMVKFGRQIINCYSSVFLYCSNRGGERLFERGFDV